MSNPIIPPHAELLPKGSFTAATVKLRELGTKAQLLRKELEALERQAEEGRKADLQADADAIRNGDTPGKGKAEATARAKADQTRRLLEATIKAVADQNAEVTNAYRTERDAVEAHARAEVNAATDRAHQLLAELRTVLNHRAAHVGVIAWQERPTKPYSSGNLFPVAAPLQAVETYLSTVRA